MSLIIQLLFNLSHCLERAVLRKVEEVYWIFAKWPSMTARSTRWVGTLKMFPTYILHVFDNLKDIMLLLLTRMTPCWLCPSPREQWSAAGTWASPGCTARSPASSRTRSSAASASEAGSASWVRKELSDAAFHQRQIIISTLICQP